jgi:peptidoglycan/LPS O-acetylase OafA/YrhL
MVAPAATSASQQNVHGYRPELDVVRFLAFLLVFVHHLLPAVLTLPKNRDASIGQDSSRILLSLHETCGMGLCLFFTLSAYLITDLLLKEREKHNVVSVRNFYIRRVLRIWPLYLFGIAIGIAIALALHQRSELTAFVWYLLFVGNFYCGAFGWPHNPMNPLWSISIEEQFYLAWPWAMRWLSRRGLMVCALFFIAIANITLFILGQRHADTLTTVWTCTLIQFQMFAVGILLALEKKRIAWRKPGNGLIAALTGPILWFVACFAFHAKQEAAAGAATGGPALMMGYGLIALGCAAVLQGFCMMGPANMPAWAARLGKISYGLYVYHMLAIGFATSLFDSTHGFIYLVASGLVAFMLTVAAATISYALLESPFLRLKRRFETLHTRPI